MAGKKEKGQASNSSSSVSTVDQNLSTALGGVIIHAASPPPPKRTPRINDIVNEFARYFGNETQVENWQKLCRDVGVDGDLPSINKCKQALVPVWVNIHDLILAVYSNTTPPRRFPSEQALAKYTRKNKQYYPKQKAKNGGPVRALLAHIF